MRTLAVISALTGGSAMLIGCLAGPGLWSGIFAFFGCGVMPVALFYPLGKEEVKQIQQQILVNRAREAGETTHG